MSTKKRSAKKKVAKKAAKKSSKKSSKARKPQDNAEPKYDADTVKEKPASSNEKRAPQAHKKSAVAARGRKFLSVISYETGVLAGKIRHLVKER